MHIPTRHRTPTKAPTRWHFLQRPTKAPTPEPSGLFGGGDLLSGPSTPSPTGKRTSSPTIAPTKWIHRIPMLELKLALRGSRRDRLGGLNILLRYLTKRTGAKGIFRSFSDEEEELHLRTLEEPNRARGTPSFNYSPPTSSPSVAPTSSIPADATSDVVVVSQPVSPLCQQAFNTSDYESLEIKLPNVEMTAIESIMEEVMSGAVQLYTDNGVPLTDIVCGASMSISMVALDDETTVNARTQKKAKTKKIVTIVCSTLGSLLLLCIVMAVYYCRFYQQRASARRSRNGSRVSSISSLSGGGSAVAAKPSTAGSTVLPTGAGAVVMPYHDDENDQR